ncbi:histidine kinase [Amycolatopsis sp. NEAU-NG30]|uniref:histidine kinase n=1 Tax=Amycolatopsis melonis TaxID=3156488 RepID=A0ABV0L8Q9_9PSEU
MAGLKRQPLSRASWGNPLTVCTTTVTDLLLFSDVLLPLGPGMHSAPLLTSGWALAGGALLWWRLRAPLAVESALCAHAVLGSLLLSYRPVLFVCVALASVVARGDRRTTTIAVAASALTVAAWVANELRTSPEVSGSSKVELLGVTYLLLVGTAAGIGRWQRAGILQRRELARRNAREARRAVAAERRRMAQELHDIIAHAIAVMVLQIGGARSVLVTDADRAATALKAAEGVGAQAIDELRRLLVVLRAEIPEAGDAGGPVRAPHFAELDTLLQSFRVAGLEVRFAESGPRGTLDASVDLAAYRVVQEALTNTTKHGGPGARTDVGVRWHDETVVITIDDHRATAAEPAGTRLSTGHGLIGLAERVSTVGGVFHAGACRDGFTVRAELPCRRP